MFVAYTLPAPGYSVNQTLGEEIRTMGDMRNNSNMAERVVNTPSMVLSTRERFISAVFEYRHGLVAAVGILALFFLWSDVRVFPAELGGFYVRITSAVAGTILILVGVGTRIWAGLYIGGHKNTDLVTRGPYSLTRNPLYVGNMISTLGVMAMTQSLAATLFVLIGLSVIYISTIAHEENKLLKFFGNDYIDYTRSTPRLIPGRESLRELLSGNEANDRISYRNLAREMKRGGLFLITGMLVLLLTSFIH